jgi:hypothetical protein
MANMQVRVVRLRDYLDVEVTGRLDLAELLGLILRLEAVTQDQGDTRLLLDLTRVEGVPHVAVQMQVGEQIVKCLSHLASVASVVPPDRLTRASENVARSHGVRMKVFDSKDPAIAWLRETEPAPDVDRMAMGPAHVAIWDAVRHLFPLHAQAIQLPNGSLAISWAVPQRAGGLYEMATPITVRMEPDLEERLRMADAEQRKRIATQQEAVFRAGLMGYDPATDVPKARVITLG